MWQPELLLPVYLCGLLPVASGSEPFSDAYLGHCSRVGSPTYRRGEGRPAPGELGAFNICEVFRAQWLISNLLKCLWASEVKY